MMGMGKPGLPYQSLVFMCQNHDGAPMHLEVVDSSHPSYPLLPPLVHIFGYIVYSLPNYLLELVNTICHILLNHADFSLCNCDSARDKHRQGIIAYEDTSHPLNIKVGPLEVCG